MTTAVVRSTRSEIFGIATLMAEFCLILAVFFAQEVSVSSIKWGFFFIFHLANFFVFAHVPISVYTYVCVRRQGVRTCMAKWSPAVVSSQTLITILLQSRVTALCSGSYS